MNSTPDPALLAAHDLALAALHEITPVATVGSAAGYTVEADGVVSLRFETTLRGYPGWFWTVSVARVGEDQPTVLEVELLPGEEALLAPEWVPWAVRLADYQAAQAALAAEAASGDEDDDSDAGVDDAREGTVTVRVQRPGSSLHLTVDDDGHGLPAGFDLAGSTSLGLSIVRTLVESELGGHLALGQVPHGPGTRVDIDLPLD